MGGIGRVLAWVARAAIGDLCSGAGARTRVSRDQLTGRRCTAARMSIEVCEGGVIIVLGGQPLLDCRTTFSVIVKSKLGRPMTVEVDLAARPMESRSDSSSRATPPRMSANRATARVSLVDAKRVVRSGRSRLVLD
jgi:hypothetical protein